MRLSYHGMRAKNTNGSTTRFNSDYELIADKNLPIINIVPQDMGRVLLNLINNAFYAVQQRATVEASLPDAPAYKPAVAVSTQYFDNEILKNN